MRTRKELEKLLEARKSRVETLDLIIENRVPERANLALPYLSDSDGIVRATALECIASEQPKRAYLKDIIKLLKDEWPTTRISAIEYMVDAGAIDHLHEIFPLLSDIDPLVRAYSIWAITNLGDGSCSKLLESKIDIKASDYELISIHFFRLIHEEKIESLDFLIRELSNESYGVRCFSASTLVDTAESLANFRTRIADAVEAALKIENTIAGKECLERALQELNELLEKL